MMNTHLSFDFAERLLVWFDEHGRKHLPWQDPIEPYRVWLSEVMLQQTQVETVIPYFMRFVDQFPTVHSLARAPLNDVLHLWTGLGYYARARNLHKCAQMIVDEYRGKFPPKIEQLSAMPGIGKSTACAITSIAFGQATAILDGNVKRVLARFHKVEGWTGSPAVAKKLWAHAEHHMPSTRCADYTQAIMDLGATLCKRSKPECHRCPVQRSCQAYQQDDVKNFPGKKPAKKIPTKSIIMLIAQDTTKLFFLEQRPPQGIWGGLWSFLEFADSDSALDHCLTLGKIEQHERWPEITHAFSHYRLRITPLLVKLKRTPATAQNDTKRWVTLDTSLTLGLAAPVKRLITEIQLSKTFI